MKRIPIFKPGRHIAASGAAVSFSEDDLAKSIAAYDPKLHQAPIVIGHPKDNHPAWGWVTGMGTDQGEVFAETEQVAPEFAEMVKAGRFKTRSASWYTPDSPNNPVPGVYYLRHVGFLGAQPPAVKGLGPVQFAEDEEGVVEFADGTVAISLAARLMRGLRDTLLAKWGQEETEKALPGYLVEDLEAEARRSREMPAEAPIFNEQNEDETMTPEQIAELQAKAAKADALEAQNAELQASVASFAEGQKKAERAARVAGFKSELQPLVEEGRVLPAELDGMAEFMANLDDAIEVAEFSEGETKRTQLAYFREQLKKRPKAIDFEERSGSEGDNATDSRNAQKLGEDARAYRDAQAAKGINISFTEATDAVLNGAK